MQCKAKKIGCPYDSNYSACPWTPRWCPWINAKVDISADLNLQRCLLGRPDIEVRHARLCPDLPIAVTLFDTAPAILVLRNIAQQYGYDAASGRTYHLAKGIADYQVHMIEVDRANLGPWPWYAVDPRLPRGEFTAGGQAAYNLRASRDGFEVPAGAILRL